MLFPRNEFLNLTLLTPVNLITDTKQQKQLLKDLVRMSEKDVLDHSWNRKTKGKKQFFILYLNQFTKRPQEISFNTKLMKRQRRFQASVRLIYGKFGRQ